MHPRLLTLAAAALLLPSCAYMQTHQNVREQGRSYPGYQLTHPQQIYRSQGRWYVAAAPAAFRLHHDVIHDNVFRMSQAPVMQLLSAQNTPAYHAISPHTAAVLLRSDGYVDTATLAQELKDSPDHWLPELPHATAHAVKAQVVGAEETAITYAPTPEEPPLRYRVLSGLDLAFVDVPGTILYNVAVPVIAPFVFFYEFLQD